MYEQKKHRDILLLSSYTEENDRIFNPFKQHQKQLF